MKSLLTGILLSAVTLNPAFAATMLEQAIHTASGMQVDFVQKFTAPGFKSQQVERGTVTFGAPPKMRWTYVSPEAKTFVFDGERSWLYSPADRQVTVTRVTDEDRRAVPFLLISDPAGLHRHFTVVERVKGGSVTALVKPRAGSAPIREVTVTIDRASRQIRALNYVDRQGNRTAFEFVNYRKAPSRDLAFRFDPPPGVDVIESQR